MLTMKRAQLERSLREEETRLRHIESRIAQIDRQGGIGDYDVVVKSVAAMPFLSLRCSCENMDEVVQMVRAVAEDGGRQIRPSLRDKLIVVARNDRDDEKLDLEIGFSLLRASNANVRIAGDHMLRAGELPAVDTMATIVRPGTNAASHGPFGAIGMWIEANGYEVAGPCREVFLEPITGPPGFEGALVEIQFPVRAAA
jgi:effector-binding domain-containing protein